MSEEVVAGLLNKRATLAGQIELAQLEVRRLISDLDAVDAALRIFAPDLATETPKGRRAPPQHQALRGAVKATLRGALAEANEPVTTEALALKLLKDRHLPTTDDRLRKLFIQRVGAALFTMARDGEVRRTETKIGRFVGWVQAATC